MTRSGKRVRNARSAALVFFALPEWEMPAYYERLKQSYYRLQEAFGSIR